MTGPTIESLAMKARQTFDRNIDTMIAAFLLRNPDVNPADIELAFQPSLDGKMRFWISHRPNGVKLPAPKPIPERESGGEYGYPDGWNACIEEVKRLNARTDDQMRAPLPGAAEDVEVKQPVVMLG